MSAADADGGLRVGIADHLGWAVAVTADVDHQVVDRRRIELVEPGAPNMPLHHDSKTLDVDATTALVAQVRASVARSVAAALDQLPGPVISLSLRTWPDDFPADIAVQMRVPWEARADAVMYRQVLAAEARSRDWHVHLYDAKTAEAEATAILGPRARSILHDPRTALGPPWAKDHRTALAATVLPSL
jgi:hypothetical protein